MKKENFKLILSVVVFFLVFCVIPFSATFFLRIIDIGWFIIYFIIIFPLIFLALLYFSKRYLNKLRRYKFFLLLLWILFFVVYISLGFLFYFGFSMSFAL
jgi:hypothetical protein